MRSSPMEARRRDALQEARNGRNLRRMSPESGHRFRGNDMRKT